jgi:two-component sensor histidine kinase
MALIHELFYQSGNFSTIDLRDYIQTLYSNLENMYVDVSMHVQTSIIIDDISLPLDTAIPCGLALNELITNALKYAFRERRTGSLSILGRNEGGMVRMTVKDDGPGIPEGVTLDNPNTLGLRLVTNIAIQLGGDASYRFDGGAEFGLSFPLP